MDLLLCKTDGGDEFHGDIMENSTKLERDLLEEFKPIKAEENDFIGEEPWIAALENPLLSLVEEDNSVASSVSSDPLDLLEPTPFKGFQDCNMCISPRKASLKGTNGKRQKTFPFEKPAKSHKRQRIKKTTSDDNKEADEKYNYYRGIIPTVQVTPTGDQSSQSCPFPGCSHKSPDYEALCEHMKLHRKGEKRHFECKECGQVFYSSGCLTSHAITHIRGGNTAFCCKVAGCGKRYATAEGLRLHTRNHHQVYKTWKCMAEGCDISFVRKSDLQMHIIRMHTKERPYPCTQKDCSKSFACHSELRRHMLKFHNLVHPKLSKNGGDSERPKQSSEFERLIKEATAYRMELRRKRAEEKARIQKERKAQMKLLRAKAKAAKKAAKAARVAEAAMNSACRNIFPTTYAQSSL